MPPVSVSPPIPVSTNVPPGTKSEWGTVAPSTSSHSAPPPARASRRSGSTVTVRIRRRSTTSAPSAIACPETLCPPPRMATGRPVSRAARTAATTSSVVAGWTMTAGRRSTMPLNDSRASSYPSSPGRRTRALAPSSGNVSETMV